MTTTSQVTSNAMDETTRGHIAKAIIYVFLGVTVLLILTAISGLVQWNTAEAMFKTWSASYSLLVGAIIGYYFRDGGSSRKQDTDAAGATNNSPKADVQ